VNIKSGAATDFWGKSGLSYVCFVISNLKGAGFMTKIVVDSSCDMPQDFILQHDISVMPLFI